MAAFQNCAANSSSESSQNQTSGSEIDTSHLYVGAYQEDAQANPEDPTSGVLYLNIPDSGPFNGEMFFTYVGCQSSNIGNVTGTRAGLDLIGSWDGTLDETSQSGAFAGSWVPAQSYFTGTYKVAKGKQQG